LAELLLRFEFFRCGCEPVELGAVNERAAPLARQGSGRKVASALRAA
jgi:hypothetical protein